MPVRLAVPAIAACALAVLPAPGAAAPHRCLASGPAIQCRGADLHGTDLRGRDLRGADLRGADLRRANLSGARLQGARLDGALLRGARIHGSNLHDASLRRADLRGALIGTRRVPGSGTAEQQAATPCPVGRCVGTNLSGANLAGVNLAGARLFLVNLSRANLTSAFIAGTSFVRTNLGGANLSGASTVGPDLVDGVTQIAVGASLQQGSVTGADFTDANLTALSLWRIDLSAATVSGAYTQATWVLQAAENYGGVTGLAWPSLSCAYPAVPYGAPAPDVTAQPCTVTLPNGGSVRFGLVDGVGLAAQIAIPAVPPSWYPVNRFTPRHTTTVSVDIPYGWGVSLFGTPAGSP